VAETSNMSLLPERASQSEWLRYKHAAPTEQRQVDQYVIPFQRFYS